MANSTPVFPNIEFHDTYGYVHTVKEITEDKNFDGIKRITYTTHEGEEFYFLIKEK